MRQVSIMTDKNGNIVSVSELRDVGDKVSGITKAGIYPEAGHTLHEIQLPAELESASLLEIHKGFKIDLTHGKAQLKKA